MLNARRAGLEPGPSFFEVKEIGRVREVRGVVARVTGLPTCLYGQYAVFESGVPSMVVGFNEKDVLALVLGDPSKIRPGDTLTARSEPVHFRVSPSILGRVVSALGQPLDCGAPLEAVEARPVFRDAPGVMERLPISEQLFTGTKIIDTIIPIGKGQRELIIGDRMTGKTTLALDAILNQKETGVLCVYCLVGRTKQSLARVVDLLSRRGAMAYTVVLAETADASPGEQYLAPYAAAAIGEYFMERGKDVLVVFDDLTKHAWIHRQISLLVGRAPGREAYPGDMFFVHSQLVERAGRLRSDHGGGTMTFLPIVETLQGDVTGHIPSNLISMTDGQVYLSTALFNQGVKPAIDIGLSVSRIGNKVQPLALKEVAKTLRYEYTQHAELVKLTRLRSGFAGGLAIRLRRGQALKDILLQDKNVPVPFEAEVLLFYALQSKALEQLSPQGLAGFCRALGPFFQKRKESVLEELRRERTLTPALKQTIDQALRELVKREGLEQLAADAGEGEAP